MHYIYRGNGAGHLLWIAGYFMTPIVKNPHGFYWVDVIDFRWSGVVSGCRAHSYFKSLWTFKIGKLFNSLWNSFVPIFFLVQSQNFSYWTRKVVQNRIEQRHLNKKFCIESLQLKSSKWSILFKKLLSKLNFTFLFSPFCSNIENIEPKLYLHGF